MPANITLSSGQVISGSDPNYSEYAAQAGSGNAADSPNAPAGIRNLQTMTLNQAKSQAETAFSGIVAPMSLADIRAREEAAQKVIAETASSVYNPQISREKQTGAAQVSTGEGVVGQRQGFNISTAELAFVGDIQNKVQDRIKEVENTKAAYISSGNLAAADRADSQIQQLNEFNSQMIIAKANYALQLMAGNREEASLQLESEKLALDTKAQAFSENIRTKELANSTAALLGYTDDGSPTYQATQDKIQNAFEAANITGYYNGTETLAAATAKADIALRRAGLEIDKAQLAEQIRSNRAGEAAKTSSDKSPSGLVNAAVNRLDALKTSGNFNALNYRAELIDIAQSLGYDGTSATESVLNEAGSALNNALNAKRPGIMATTSTNINDIINDIKTSVANGTIKIKTTQSPTADSTSTFFGLK